MLLLKQSFSLLLSFFGILIFFFKKNIFYSAFLQFESEPWRTISSENILIFNMDIVAENGELVRAHFRSSLLDLAAAFDTINQSILKPRLKTSFVFSGSASLLVPYLSLRPRPVYVNHSKSLTTILQFRVSQGSVLGPNTFILYTQMKSQISDDTQHYATAHLSKAF